MTSVNLRCEVVERLIEIIKERVEDDASKIFEKSHVTASYIERDSVGGTLYSPIEVANEDITFCTCMIRHFQELLTEAKKQGSEYITASINLQTQTL